VPNPQNVPPRWKKGESGNPNGRPPKTINSIMRELGEGTLLDVKMNIRMSDGTVRTKIIDLTTETNKRKYRATINEVVASTVIQQAIAGDVQSQKMLIESQDVEKGTAPPPQIVINRIVQDGNSGQIFEGSGTDILGSSE
jgi:hypothetical protein